MAATKRRARKGKPQQKHISVERPLRERRFLPVQTAATRASLLAGALATVALGAGVYGQWLAEEPHAYARWLFAGGAIGLGLALIVGDAGAKPVRVGEAGVALETGSEIERLAWWEIQSITSSAKTLRIGAANSSFSLPRSAHLLAIAHILAEAKQRCPATLKGATTSSDGLPVAMTEGVGTIDAELQLAGRRCAASERPIAMERDAIVCPNCAQVFHREHLPTLCVSCRQPLGSRGIAPGT